ncbi:MAG TPA: hypothetical protein PL151_20640, partial [Phycisphaerae bacterium]|nr:hypothetical protein [Phycisphaerae bacterium]
MSDNPVVRSAATRRRRQYVVWAAFSMLAAGGCVPGSKLVPFAAMRADAAAKHAGIASFEGR